MGRRGQEEQFNGTVAMSSSQLNPVDAADEAGGEAVFSSDGLPPLPTPRTPKIAGHSSSSNGGVVVDDDDDVLDTGDPALAPSDAIKIFSTSNESPQERLLRLQRELAELEQDLKTDDVANLAAQISSHLNVGLRPRDDLIKLMDKHMEQQQQKVTSGATEGTVVYELYGGQTPSSASSSSSIEERILKLEQAVGGTASTSLSERVQEMESKIQRVDKKSIEEASTRAKVIRSDLEAASKARSKLTTTTSSADSKIISELYTQLQQLEGVSGHLPALTHRLQQLAHLHVQGANFAGRLGSAESSLATIQGTLGSVEASLSKLEDTMAESVKVMDANLKKLESTINK
uniref:Uncharacterized protein n=1 Tax=Cyclophora tenuis TaxID=216820 RepID=A0A7S1GHI5_CYCTE